MTDRTKGGGSGGGRGSGSGSGRGSGSGSGSRRRTPAVARKPEAASLADAPPATRLKDIAKVAGVSLQTVSNVMNNSGSVSSEVRDRVREIGERMGYRPNRSAKAMRTGRSQTLGLVVSDLSNPFYAEFARAVERAAALARYAVLLVDAQAPAAATSETVAIARRIAELRSHPVDGVVSTVRFPSVLKLDVPVVLLGLPARGRDSVTSDDERGGEALAEHLLSLGHRRFGLITSPLPGGIPIRRDALIKRLRGVGEVVWEHQTPPTEKVTADAAELLLRRDVSVIVCSNDIVAISVQHLARSIGVAVPGEVSVVGYDDIPWAAIVTPALTTMRLPIPDMGRVAVQYVLERLDEPNRRSRRLSLPVALIERESVTRIASA